VHPTRLAEEGRGLVAGGLSPGAAGRRLGVSRSTVRYWTEPRSGHGSRRVKASPFERLPLDSYAYLLGLYLGDGWIATSPRIEHLRIFLDGIYPGILREAAEAMRAVRPDNKVDGRKRKDSRCVVVSSYSVWWSRLLPQHGPGRRHERTIALHSWQTAITQRFPERFVRGLIHSDGCRFVARQRVGDRVYPYVRYSFSNRSEDIKRILCAHLELLGVDWTRPNAKCIEIARRRSVLRLEQSIGPKT